MNKILCVILSVVIMLPCVLALSACGDDDKVNAVTLSINPSVTFLVDSNDEVISVNYNNSDAGEIYFGTKFEDKDISTAVETFIELATISGYISMTNLNDFDMKITGEGNVDKLKSKVHTKVKAVCEKLGIRANAVFSNVETTFNALLAQAKALAPELKLKLDAMTQEDLGKVLKIIEEKQEEYEDLTYNQIKEMLDTFSYGVNKILIEAIETAKDAITFAENSLAKADLSPEMANHYKKQLRTAKKAYDKAIKAVEELIEELVDIEEDKAKAEKAKLKNSLKIEVTAFKANINTGGALNSELTSHQVVKLNKIIAKYFPEN